MRIRQVGAALLAVWVLTLWLLPSLSAAEEGNGVYVSLRSPALRGYTGDRITVVLSMEQSKSLSIANGQMTLTYDTTQLRYVSCRGGGALAGCMMADNETANGVRIGFLTVDAIPAQGELLLFTFEVMATAPDVISSLSLRIEEWVDGNNEQDYASQVAVNLGDLTLNPTATLTMASGEAAIGRTATVALSATGTTSPQAADLLVTLSYDETKLQLMAVESVGVGVASRVETPQAGQAQITWEADDTSVADGTLMKLTFLVKEGASTDERLPVDLTVAWHDTGGADRTAWVTVQPGTILALEAADSRWGDVNGDGKVTVSDVRLTLRAAVGKTTLSEAQAWAADVNGDGRVTISDVRTILRTAVGKL